MSKVHVSTHHDAQRTLSAFNCPCGLRLILRFCRKTGQSSIARQARYCRRQQARRRIDLLLHCRMSGVRSAMPSFQAKRLCPNAVFVPPRMAEYVKASKEIREEFDKLTPSVEPLSIDEAFLDMSGTQKLHHASPAQSLAKLARTIEEKVGVTISIGLSHNKFLAKIASDLDKPRGMALIGKQETVEFLADKPVTIIYGIGKKIWRTT